MAQAVAPGEAVHGAVAARTARTGRLELGARFPAHLSLPDARDHLLPRLADSADLSTRCESVSPTTGSSIRQPRTGSGCRTTVTSSHDPLFWQGIKRAFIFTADLRARHDLHPDGGGGLHRPGQSNKLSTVYRVISAHSGDDPGAVDLHSLALDVQQLRRSDQLRSRRCARHLSTCGTSPSGSAIRSWSSPRSPSWSGGGGSAITRCSFWPGWRRSRATSLTPPASTAPASGACSGESPSGGCCRSFWSWW